MGGLAPGEYRVLALAQDTLIKNMSNLLPLLSRAEKVTLERGSLKDVSLKIVEP